MTLKSENQGQSYDLDISTQDGQSVDFYISNHGQSVDIFILTHDQSVDLYTLTKGQAFISDLRAHHLTLTSKFKANNLTFIS